MLPSVPERYLAYLDRINILRPQQTLTIGLFNLGEDRAGHVDFSFIDKCHNAPNLSVAHIPAPNWRRIYLLRD